MQQNSKNGNETSQKLCPDIDHFWPNVDWTIGLALDCFGTGALIRETIESQRNIVARFDSRLLVAYCLQGCCKLSRGNLQVIHCQGYISGLSQ